MAQTMSSREFNQATRRAKDAAARGPVVITHRGEPAFVLMTYAGYRDLIGDSRSILDALVDCSPEAEAVSFDPDIERQVFVPAEL